MRRHPEASRLIRHVLIGALLISIVGCGRKHYLAEYQFSEKALARGLFRGSGASSTSRRADGF